jgi:peptidoglycan/xylan/chitin deacetylase (PgdA/CDA1 family)
MHALAAPLVPGSFVTRGPTTTKKIALTFDDGPGPQTQKFLDLLDRYQVKATFFMLSEQVGYKKATARMVVDRGHEPASHTTRHKNYAQVAKAKSIPEAKAELVADIKESRTTIEEATGSTLQILRMPHGIDRPWIKEAAKETGFILVNWTYGADWLSTPEDQLEKSYINAIEPGAIFLFHDGGSKRDKSLKLTEAVIKAAQEQGYQIVPVGELLGIK